MSSFAWLFSAWMFYSSSSNAELKSMDDQELSFYSGQASIQIDQAHDQVQNLDFTRVKFGLDIKANMNIDNLNLRGFVQIRTYIENVEYVYFIIHVPPEFNINTKPLDDVEITSYGWVRFDRINDLYLSKAVKKILNYKIIC